MAEQPSGLRDEPTLSLDDLRFPSSCNASITDNASSGFVRERAAIRMLVRNEWFEAEQAGGQLRTKRGERAPRVREGKS